MNLLPTKKYLLILFFPIYFVLSILFLTCKDDAVSPTSSLVLSAPSEVQAELLPGGAIKISWKINGSGADGCFIERKIGKVAGFERLGSTSIGVNSLTDSTVKPIDSLLSYRVCTKLGTSVSDYSDTATVYLKFPSPYNLQFISDDDNSIDISWSDSSRYKLGFQIERKSAEESGYSIIAKVGPEARAFSDTSYLNAGTTYKYRVRGYAASIVSGATADLNVSLKYKTPTDLSVSFDGDSAAVFNWTENNTNALGIKIAYKDSTQFKFSDSVRLSGQTYRQRSTFIVNQNISFRIYSFTKRRISAPSTVVTSIIPYSAPFGFKITAVTEKKITLIWSDTSVLKREFKIERKEGNGSFGPVSGGTIGRTATTFIDTGTFKTNTLYTYRMKSQSYKNNFSYYSNTDSTFIIFLPPSDFSVDFISTKSIKLNWKDNSTLEQYFYVERKNLITNKIDTVKLNANSTGITYNDIDIMHAYLLKIRAQSSYNNFSGYAPEFRIGYTASDLQLQKQINDTTAINAVAVDSAGKLVAVGGKSGVIRVFDINTGADLATIVSDSVSEINGVALHPSGSSVAVGYNDGRLTLWDINTRTKIWSINHNSPCTSVGWALSSGTLTAGLYNGKVHIINSNTGSIIRTLSEHTYAINSVRFTYPLDTAVVTASFDGTAKFWASGTAAGSTTSSNQTNPVLSAGMIPGGGNQMVIMDSWGDVKRQWNGGNFSLVCSHGLGKGCLALLDYGTGVSGGADNMLRFWHYSGNPAEKSWSTHSNTITSMCFNPKYRVLVVGSKDKSVSVWKVVPKWEIL